MYENQIILLITLPLNFNTSARNRLFDRNKIVHFRLHQISWRLAEETLRKSKYHNFFLHSIIARVCKGS